MPLIIFSGPDGSGKSTQVNLLLEYFKSNKFRAKYSWIRALHSFALALSRIVIRMGFFRIVSNPYGNSYRIIDLKRLSVLRKFWPIIEIFSILPIILVRVKIPCLLGWIVVSERYTLDTIASIAWLIDDENFPKSRLARILVGLIPKDSCLIHLDSDYGTISMRRGNITEPFKFIEIQRQIYSDLSKSLPLWKVDTSLQNIEETHLLIRKHVLEHLSHQWDGSSAKVRNLLLAEQGKKN